MIFLVYDPFSVFTTIINLFSPSSKGNVPSYSVSFTVIALCSSPLSVISIVVMFIDAFADITKSSPSTATETVGIEKDFESSYVSPSTFAIVIESTWSPDVTSIGISTVVSLIPSFMSVSSSNVYET